jgi:thioredoxin reductase (NADPH)
VQRLQARQGLHERLSAGVFVFIGLTPNTQIVDNLVETDEHGFILTDGMLATSVPGIFAAGDCRTGSTKPAAAAAGEGAAVALAIRRYVEPRAGAHPAEAMSVNDTATMAMV